ncbi:hypothetical protein DFJ73DRAFT_658081 [Zopfochytrium polystomum]|nr:hypothetical protein DFJ73DRAFT_658081 [Zopfochytrium polystomum]
MAGQFESVTLPVIGMTCQSCVKSIKTRLGPEPGVQSVDVDLPNDKATIVFDPSLVAPWQLALFIEECGFDVPSSGSGSGEHLSQSNDVAMHDQGNRQYIVRLEKRNSDDAKIHLLAMDGIDDVDYDSQSSTLTVTYDPNLCSESIIKASLHRSSLLPPSRPQTPAGPSSGRATPTPQPVDTERQTVMINVRGMTCASCVATIESNLGKAHGVISCTVALLAETAQVQYVASELSPAKIVEMIDDLGFEAELAPPKVDGVADFKIFGMTCSSCSGTIEREVRKMNGITSISVNLLGETGHVVYDKTTVGVRDIVEKIESLGFDALLCETGSNSQIESLHRTREIQSWRTAFWTSLMFSAPIMIISMLLPKSFVNHMICPGVTLGGALMLALSAPVQFGVASRFYYSAFKALKHNSYTMDVLIVLGTTIAYAFSVCSILYSFFSGSPEPPEIFFETSASLITFVALGRYLENLAKAKTSSALSTLISLTPSYAILLQVDKSTEKVTEKKIPSELIQPGDVIKAVPGERIAADGIIVFGNSSIDESLVTGESLPISKSVGDNVIAGSINGAGMIHFKASRVGSDTTISQILKLVSDAQTSKAPVQDLADKVASIFVPGVIILGGLTFLFWWSVFAFTSWLPPHFDPSLSKFFLAVQLAISVVVVACPCALGLATPTAVMVGTGVGAQLGILIKGSGPLSVAGTLTKVAFDKTGTLTLGKMGVSSYVKSIPDNLLAKFDFIELVGCAEGGSEHPIGRAISDFCKKMLNTDAFKFTLDSFDLIAGRGIRAVVKRSDGSFAQVLVGNHSLLKEAKCHVSASQLEAIRSEEENGLTVVLAAVNNVFAGSFALSDAVKPNAASTVDAIRKLGLDVCMITGDQSRTAKAIARACNISEVHAEVSPNGKRILVEQMQKAGQVILMVGDGVNDSASLAQSDMGVAVFGGTDIAIGAASVVLMRDDIRQVVTAIDLCRRIYSRIKMNFLWATIYNVMMIPLAMGMGLPFGIYLPPMLAGMAMSLSSVSVVVSSLLLRTYRPPITHEKPLLSASEEGIPLSTFHNDEESLLDAGSSSREAPGGFLPYWQTFFHRYRKLPSQ